MIEVVMTRDSVCMADDVDAPHEHRFNLPDGANLSELARTVARSSYLPMPSDAWGWTVEVDGAVVAVCKGVLSHKVRTVRGNPASVTLRNKAQLLALYVRQGSPWRNTAAG